MISPDQASEQISETGSPQLGVSDSIGGAFALTSAIRRHAEKAPLRLGLVSSGEEIGHVCDASCADAIRVELLSGPEVTHLGEREADELSD